ncbi:fimbrial protein [Serratia marcescens]|uniref:fimbrial protein n=1 Tax=Serratia marcescens TaxID=615 RepID=UPI003896E632
MGRRVRRFYGGSHRHEWLYALVITGLLLMVPVCLCMMLWLVSGAHAADNWQVEGAHGVLRVRGELTEGACRLEMDSADQSIALGSTPSAALTRAGDRGVPVALQLRLWDCLRSPARNRDERSGNLLWSAQQPAVSVSFIAPADADSPQLVKVYGATGVGLRITDALGGDIRLGSRGAALPLAVGQSALNYRVAAERTAAPLVPGAYAAQVNFQLSYD